MPAIKRAQTHRPIRRRGLAKRVHERVESIRRAVGKVISVKVGIERKDGAARNKPYHVNVDLTLPMFGLRAGLISGDGHGRERIEAAVTRALDVARTQAHRYLATHPKPSKARRGEVGRSQATRGARSR